MTVGATHRVAPTYQNCGKSAREVLRWRSKRRGEADEPCFAPTFWQKDNKKVGTRTVI